MIARLDTMRRLTGGFATIYALARVRYLGDFSRFAPSSFAPAGVVKLLAAPLPPVVTWLLAIATVALGILFTLGRRLRVVAPAFFVALFWTLSYANSWGKLLHSENLFLLHVGVIALAGARRDEATARWIVRTASIVTVLTYAVAGITKLRGAGGLWLSGDALGDWLAWDALRKIELGSHASPLAPFVAARPVLLQVFAIYTLIVELGAPLALLSPRLARIWCALAWSFHLGVLATMWIGFFYPLTGIAFASLLPSERACARISEAVRGRVEAWRRSAAMR